MLLDIVCRISAFFKVDILYRLYHLSDTTRRREFLLRLLPSHTDEIIFQRNGLKWWIDPRDTGVSGFFFVNGHYFDEDLNGLVKWLGAHDPLFRSKSVVLDIGTTSLLLGRQTACTVFAIEPVPHTFSFLKKMWPLMN